MIKFNYDKKSVMSILVKTIYTVSTTNSILIMIIVSDDISVHNKRKNSDELMFTHLNNEEM